ncbi:MAG TPA: hypothetical protein VF278_06660 [Pirellulales bacterium]
MGVARREFMVGNAHPTWVAHSLETSSPDELEEELIELGLLDYCRENLARRRRP